MWLGIRFCVLQMSSHTTAEEDKADPSNPASQCPLHPIEAECVGSFWVARSTFSPQGWSLSQTTPSWSLTSLEGTLLFSWVYVLQPKGRKTPCKGESGNSQPGHLSHGLANVLMHQTALGMSCCCGAGGVGRWRL